MDIKKRIMDTKLFWRLYFWWGIRQARKRGMANRPTMTNDEYWEKVHNDRTNNL